MLIFFTSSALTEILGMLSTVFLHFSEKKIFCLVLDGKSWQKSPINAGVLQGLILGLTLLLFCKK